MRLLRYSGENQPFEIRPVDSKSMETWREGVVDHLNSNDRDDRGRYRYEHIVGETRGLDEPTVGERRVSRDSVLLEKPKAQKPEEPRVVVDEMVRSTVAQWQWWRKHDPDLFWRKIREAKELGGLAHLTDEQAADQVVALCRKLEEADAAATFKKRKIGGGWKGAVVLGE